MTSQVFERANRCDPAVREAYLGSDRFRGRFRVLTGIGDFMPLFGQSARES